MQLELANMVGSTGMPRWCGCAGPQVAPSLQHGGARGAPWLTRALPDPIFSVEQSPREGKSPSSLAPGGAGKQKQRCGNSAGASARPRRSRRSTAIPRAAASVLDAVADPEGARGGGGKGAERVAADGCSANVIN